MNSKKTFSKMYRLYRWIRLSAYQLSQRVHPSNYRMILAVLIGIASGFMAVALKASVRSLENWLEKQDVQSGHYAYVVFPIIGIALTWIFVRWILRKKLNTSLTELIYAIYAKRIKLPGYEMYAHAISSALTVGFGGSAGLEAPIVRTSSAIGSNLAGFIRAGRGKRILFMACGTAAGMAAIFNTPVAGVIFAFEVLMLDLAVNAFIPLLISSAAGAVIGRMLYPGQIISFQTEGWAPHAIPLYVLLGMLSGLLSVFFIRFYLRRMQCFERRNRESRISLFVFGALLLGLLVYLMPPLYGEGYSVVNYLLEGNYTHLLNHSLFYPLADNSWFLLLFAAFLIFAKALTTSLTLGIGGHGGIFAPSMFMGAILGFVFAHSLNQLGLVSLSEANFIAVAMAGTLSGIIKAPLTGIFLIAEITGGYSLIVPLMIVSAVSYFAAYFFEPHSIFTKELANKGMWVPPHERDKHILKHMNLEKLVETNFHILYPNQSLGEFVQIIAKSHRNLFPVVDQDGYFLGVVLLDDVRSRMFKQEEYDKLYVRDFMHMPQTTVDISDPMETVMERFDYYNIWNIPVLKSGRYMGFVSKSSVFNRYRELLQKQSEGM